MHISIFFYVLVGGSGSGGFFMYLRVSTYLGVAPQASSWPGRAGPCPILPLYTGHAPNMIVQKDFSSL